MNNAYLPVIGIAIVGVVLFALFYERGPTITKGYEAGDVARSAWDFAGAHGPVLAVIHGNPFAGDEQAFQRKVLDLLDRATAQRVTRYTTDPAQAVQPKTRVVLIFDAPAGADGNAICAGRIPATAPGDKVMLRMLLCSEDRLLSDVGGHIARGEDLDHPRFADLISLSLRTLINA